VSDEPDRSATRRQQGATRGSPPPHVLSAPLIRGRLAVWAKGILADRGAHAGHAGPAKKPSSIVYGVDDRPPLILLLLNAIQLSTLISVTLLFPLVVGAQAGLDPEQLGTLISLSFIALGIGSMLQALRRGPLGSGFLLPSNFTSAYVPASLLALKQGGLPLVFGMTCIAGFGEAIFSRLLPRLRAAFPPEVAGLVVLLIGLSIGALGTQYALSDAAGEPASVRALACAGLTLAIMAGLNVWAKGVLRLLCAILGIIAGYVGAGIIGELSAGTLEHITSAPLFALPHPWSGGWRVDPAMLVPFLVGALASAMITVGNVVTAQKMNDADWVRPEPVSISAAVFTDGVTSILAGLFGCVGMATSPSGTGLAGATGITSRVVAFGMGPVLLLFGCAPPLALLLEAIPRPVMGASLVFIACFVLVNGLQIITTRLLDARRTLMIGVSFALGVATALHPALFAQLPDALKPLASAPLLLGTVVAVTLNLLFRIGVRQTVRIEIGPDLPLPELENRLIAQGATWGARRDVMVRAVFGISQSVETVREYCEPEGPIELDASFDELQLNVRLAYRGTPLELPDRRPSDQEIRESEDGSRRLAGFMLRRNADRVATSARAGEHTIEFHFDH